MAATETASHRAARRPLVSSTYVSPTALDGYRYYRDHDQPVEDYVRQILRLEPPTPAMQIGIEFHQMLEDMAKAMMDHERPKPDRLKRPNAVYDFVWQGDTVLTKLPMPSVVEMPARREFNIVVPPAVSPTPGIVQADKFRVTMSGRLDAVCGLTGVDYKTTRASTINAESYQDALQWRAYLFLLPEMPDFRYDVFRIRPGKDLNQIDIVEHRAFVMTRYPGLEQDVLSAVAEYLEFLQAMERRRWLTITEFGVDPWAPPEASKNE